MMLTTHRSVRPMVNACVEPVSSSIRGRSYTTVVSTRIRRRPVKMSCSSRIVCAPVSSMIRHEITLSDPSARRMVGCGEKSEQEALGDLADAQEGAELLPAPMFQARKAGWR